MQIYCIGDSLTEGDYGIPGKSGIPNVQKKNYPYFLAEELACQTHNYGKCGFKASDYLRYYESGEAVCSEADIILILLGTNGDHSMEVETESNAAYRILLKRLQKDAPAAQIILMTPPHTTEDPGMSNFGYAGQVQESVKFVRQLAEEENLPLIDLALHKKFCAENERIYQANDGLHFVEAGYRELAHIIAEQLREMFPE